MAFRGARVLEIGCGSGENSLIHAMNGASLTFVEPLEFSVNHLKRLFRRHGLEKAIEHIHIDLLENVELNRNYDIIIAEGLISTLKDPKKIMRTLSTLG